MSKQVQELVELQKQYKKAHDKYDFLANIDYQYVHVSGDFLLANFTNYEVYVRDNAFYPIYLISETQDVEFLAVMSLVELKELKRFNKKAYDRIKQELKYL